MGELTHLDEKGRARMVDVGSKEPSRRRAVAGGRVSMSAATLRRITDGDIPKGDVLAVARTAAVMAAKQTPLLIPLCHPLALSAVEVGFEPDGDEGLSIKASVAVTDRTGAEMEALVAVSVAALTVYDMCKAVDRTMVVGDIMLLEKEGGRSGHFRR